MRWRDFDLDAGANVPHDVGHGLRECRRQLLVGHDMSLHPKPLQETIPASFTCFDRAPATVDSIEAIGRPFGSQVRRIVERNGPNVGPKGTPQGDRLSIDIHPQDPNEQRIGKQIAEELVGDVISLSVAVSHAHLLLRRDELIPMNLDPEQPLGRGPAGVQGRYVGPQMRATSPALGEDAPMHGVQILERRSKHTRSGKRAAQKSASAPRRRADDVRPRGACWDGWRRSITLRSEVVRDEHAGGHRWTRYAREPRRTRWLTGPWVWHPSRMRPHVAAAGRSRLAVYPNSYPTMLLTVHPPSKTVSGFSLCASSQRWLGCTEGNRALRIVHPYGPLPSEQEGGRPGGRTPATGRCHD